MFVIQVQDSEIKALERQLAAFGGKIAPVISRALNRTAEQARSRIVKHLSERSGLKQKDVRKRVLLRKATYKNWSALLKFPIRGIYAYAMGAKQTAKGVTFQTTFGRSLEKHAFIATMKSGHVGVFKRTIESFYSSGSRKGRLPIEEIMAMSGREVWRLTEEIIALASQESRQRLEKNIADQVQVILNRRRAG